MKSRKVISLGFVPVLVAAIMAIPRVVKAGPPLICHAIEIGNAKSLPWTSDTWNLSGRETYDIRHLVDDTLALLAPETPVLVRMETLRRATLYAAKDPGVANELLVKLRDRTTEAEAANRHDALSAFDFGYLVECYKQANWIFKKDPNAQNGWLREERPNPATGLDGYAWVQKALDLRGSDSEMEFAAALITLDGPRANHQEHVQKALAGAKSDPLLAQNLAVRLGGSKGETTAEMLARVEEAKK